MANVITPGKTIGIIGGGVLGRMLALSAKKMGYRVGILDPTPDCSAAQAADWQLIGDINDPNLLTEMAFKSDVVTMEAEHVFPESARRVSRTVAFPQGTELLDIAQDRILEKAYLEAANFNIAPYATIVSSEDIETASKELGFPCALKTLHRDKSKKQKVILYSEEDFERSKPLLVHGTCILEALIPFEKQLSVSVVRNAKGEMRIFPISENLYRNDLLYETIFPANITEDVEEEVNRIGHLIAERSNLVGTLTVELLLTSSGALYVDDITPTIHDSGLSTLDACSISLFDSHIRAICGWPLPEITLFSRAITVKTLNENQPEVESQLQLKPSWHFYYYGVEKSTEHQAIGHTTVLTNEVETTRNLLRDTGVLL
ncbi:ATP-grasp domain-containing protein [Desemzia sp. RIT804]|uniref:5-(carboxyamino)imidazole ribonucleotide synthase n=1 Tax=Desemzia sp. RIT 804 TaxID=2810209 RepID=UPI00195010BC|nr:ATP-grasp domain-containing protein [Desemzia sp. RIT 804]